MAMDISRLGVFAQIRTAENSKGLDVLRLGADGSIHAGGKLSEHNVFRLIGRDATGNNEVRAQLLKALGDTYGIQGAAVQKDGKISFSQAYLTQLENTLGETLKLNDYGIDEKTGFVTSGKPLTERRIVAIVNKVYSDAMIRSIVTEDVQNVGDQIDGMRDSAKTIAEHESAGGQVGHLSREQFEKFAAEFKAKFTDQVSCLTCEKIYGADYKTVSGQFEKMADLLRAGVESGSVDDRQAMRLMYMLTDGLAKWGDKADAQGTARFIRQMCALTAETLKLCRMGPAGKELVTKHLADVEDSILKYALRKGEHDDFVDLGVDQHVAKDLAAFEKSVNARIRHEMRAGAPESAPKAGSAKSVMRLEADPKALLDVLAGKLEQRGLKLGKDYSLTMGSGTVKFKFGSDVNIDGFLQRMKLSPAMQTLAQMVLPAISNLELDFNVTVEDGKIRVGLDKGTLPSLLTSDLVKNKIAEMIDGRKDATLNANPDLIESVPSQQRKEMVEEGVLFWKKTVEKMVDTELASFTIDPKEIFAELHDSTGADLAITGFGVSEKGVACELGVRTGEPVKAIEPKGVTDGNMASVHVSYDGLNETMRGVLENIGVAFRPDGGVQLESRSGDLMRLTLTGLDIRNTIGGKVGFGLVNNIAQTVIGSSAEKISIAVTPRFNPVTHQIELHFMDADSSGPTGRLVAALVKKALSMRPVANKIAHAKGLPKGVGLALPQAADLSKVPGSRLAVTIDVDNLLGKGETADLLKGDLSRLKVKPVRDGFDVTFGAPRVGDVSAKNVSAPGKGKSAFLSDYIDVTQG